MQGLAVNLVPALHSHILTLKYSDMGPLLDLPHKKKKQTTKPSALEHKQA